MQGVAALSFASAATVSMQSFWQMNAEPCRSPAASAARPAAVPCIPDDADEIADLVKIGAFDAFAEGSSYCLTRSDTVLLWPE